MNKVAHLPHRLVLSAVAGLTAGSLWMASPPLALASGGVASPSPTSLSFGSIYADVTTADESLTITNTGTGTLDLGAPSVSYQGGPEFVDGPVTFYSVAPSSSCPGAALAAGASCTLTLTFAAPPGAAPGQPIIAGSGLIDATLEIPSDGSGGDLFIPLIGTEIWPSLPTVSSTSFGPVAWGASATDEVTLTNNGSTPTPILGTDSLPTVGQSFSFSKVTGDDTCLGTSLAPDTSCTIGMSFTNNVPFFEAPTAELPLWFSDGEGLNVTLNVDAAPEPSTPGVTSPSTPAKGKPTAPANATDPVVSLSTGTADGVDAVAGGRPATATVTVSAPGTAQATIETRIHGRWKVVKRIKADVRRPGAVSLPLRDPRLEPGTYRVTVTARSAGTASAPVHFPLHVRPQAARHRQTHVTRSRPSKPSHWRGDAMPAA